MFPRAIISRYLIKEVVYTLVGVTMVLFMIFMSGLLVRLDCGHCCAVGHNLANTLIIHSLGGGRLETICHECY